MREPEFNSKSLIVLLTTGLIQAVPMGIIAPVPAAKKLPDSSDEYFASRRDYI